MFIGHWAPALAIAARPKAPALGVLFIAAQLVDWAFFGLLIAGVEHMRFSPGISAMNPMDLYHMPYSHSLVGGLVLASLLMVFFKDRTTALLFAVVVVSHWFLDLLVHVPDLTLTGSPPKLGFGLWNYPMLEMPLELGITFGALWLYVRAKRPTPLRVGVLAGVLLLLQAVNWFGPVEPEVTTGTSVLAFVAFGLATLAAWWMGKSATKPA